MYALFDHTADLGLRATGPTLDSVFEDAARALLAAMVERPAAVKAVSEFLVEVHGTDREFLLFDWLRAILAEFEVSRRVFVEFEVKMRDDGFEAVARGEELDEARHGLGHEVKAITYHGLRCEPTAAGWLAEVIVDI